MSRHGAPVRTRHRIPSINCRLFHNDGRPGRDGAGSNGSSATHCSSVRSNRLVTAKVSTRSPVVFRFFLVDEPTTGDLAYFSRRHALHRQLQPDLPEQTSIQALAVMSESG